MVWTKAIQVQHTDHTEPLRCRLIPEDDLTEARHWAISALLVAAFPRNAAAFSGVSYLASRPEYRLWIEDGAGRLVAHLDFERRVIAVGGVALLVAGVGEVAVRPDRQGHGLGRLLMAELETVLRTEIPVQFGLLYCLEELIPFYTRVGWQRVAQPSRITDPETGDMSEGREITFVLPVLEPMTAWPREGTIDLRGRGW